MSTSSPRGCLLGAVLVLSGRFAGAQPGTPIPAPGLPWPEVIVSRPITREVREHEDFTGRLEARTAVEIRLQVGGTIEKVAFQDGAMVQQGDLLFAIDPSAYQAELEKAEAEVRRCEARLRRANADRDRAEKRRPGGAIGQGESAGR